MRSRATQHWRLRIIKLPLEPIVSPTQSSPPDCFVLKIGTRVHGDAGEGTVVGARCSPANQFTQYWIRKPNGERFWATSQELKRM